MFDGLRSTIRLLITLPRRTIERVEIMFRTIFVAVPHFRRVEPVRISAPRFGAITTSGRCGRSIFRDGLKHRRTVWAPRFRASDKAPQTNGVRPLAAMPIRVSLLES